ncbi:MAG: NADH-quinone oxidoreductase subunit K [Spirochaetes bacterium]|nr:MAG: NADH-quinone oxidoreductase subunit K [Spirochaetota bacterium]
MTDSVYVFWLFGIFVALLAIVGFYCILITSNLIRTLIGLEIVTKAVTLLIILVGRTTNNTGLAQSFVITLIVVEVVVIVVASGVVISVFRRNGTVDANLFRNLKG